jgi:hypothetical protein
MEHTARTYFTENGHEDVKGFTILKAQDGKYHIAEKWLKSEDNHTWLDYWISEKDLESRIEDNLCEESGTLTDEQFKAVCQNVDWYTEQFETPVSSTA